MRQNIFIFFEIFLKSGKSHSAEKCKKGGLWSFRTTILLQNRKKIEGGPLGDIEKIREKKSHKAEVTCKKN